MVSFEEGQTERLDVGIILQLQEVRDGNCDRFHKLKVYVATNTDPEDGRDRSQVIRELEWAVQSHTNVDSEAVSLGNSPFWDRQSEVMFPT
jgi:hypothetical protein